MTRPCVRIVTTVFFALNAASLTYGQSPLAIPEPLRQEHEHLHEELAEAMEAGGRTGDVAQEVEQVLSSHFEEENELVMPLLGLLKPLAEGNVTEEMRPAIEMSREVREKLPQFLDEHQVIHDAVNRLIEAAEAENKPQVAEFGRQLALHAQQEEAVLYPAAVLVGERIQDSLE